MIKRRANDLLMMRGLNETMDRLAMVNSINWYGVVLRREDVHVLRRALVFDVDGQRKSGCMEEVGCGRKCEGLG